VVRLLARTPGAVVAAGDVLAELACDEDAVQVELSVPQRGFALVTPGQSVKLRYDAFPYERYGVKGATLRWTSPAATGSEAGSFRALAELHEQSVRAGSHVRRVLPGMRGQASIVVGRRTLVSFALEPLRRLRESMAVPDGGQRP
jgi:multidrug efflux pump subunit AcrA (membrane-fusion protein)